jgi:tRNA(adenine34) deaminase
MSTADVRYMQEALRQARLAFEDNEVPIGAVIVLNKDIIARAYNQVERLHDPTAHAEMVAITQATNHLGTKWLERCVLYTTIEPCSMCAGAMVLARLKRVCFGAKDAKAGACGSVFDIACNRRLNHRLEVAEGMCADECGEIMTEFFRRQRALGKK